MRNVVLVSLEETRVETLTQYRRVRSRLDKDVLRATRALHALNVLHYRLNRLQFIFIPSPSHFSRRARRGPFLSALVYRHESFMGSF